MVGQGSFRVLEGRDLYEKYIVVKQYKFDPFMAIDIAEQAVKLQEKYNVKLNFHNDKAGIIPATDFLLLIDLPVDSSNKITVNGNSIQGKNALLEFEDYLNNYQKEEKNICSAENIVYLLHSAKNIIEKDVLANQNRVNHMNGWSSIRFKSETSKSKQLRELGSNANFADFIGCSPVINEILTLAGKAAKVHSTVLLIGASGTGKEVIAEGIHKASLRNNAPLIKINCSAIPENLLESELFGHEKGAFTGAIKRKLGKFELANKGTIFLDEIGEMDLALQSKLLRVLQNRQIERVGAESSIDIDVRVIAATNRDLAKMVQVGEFREDLYYRLNVIPIKLPDLVERKNDIPLLAEYFLKKYDSMFGKNIMGFKNEVMDCFLNYSWPGNVRELQNIVERVVALSEDKYITLNDIMPQWFNDYNVKDDDDEKLYQDIINGELLPLEDYEKQIIRAALEKYDSYTAAGKALGITHKTVAAKAQKYGIDFERGNYRLCLKSGT